MAYLHNDMRGHEAYRELLVGWKNALAYYWFSVYTSSPFVSSSLKRNITKIIPKHAKLSKVQQVGRFCSTLFQWVVYVHMRFRPVYFAEKKTSLGKDWHASCLRCTNPPCNKVLTPGSHSEHEGQPYCTQCHRALFGPKTYGFGGTESHTYHGGQTGTGTS